ncbi:MAG: hypothetical protein WCD28_12015, partial [Nitrososphaeraceae archaeon]
LLLHVSAGFPTASRSRLWIARTSCKALVDCACEICSIDDGTVRIAAATRITIIFIDTFLSIIQQILYRVIAY